MSEHCRIRSSFQSSPEYSHVGRNTAQRDFGVRPPPHIPRSHDPFRWWKHNAIHLYLFETRISHSSIPFKWWIQEPTLAATTRSHKAVNHQVLIATVPRWMNTN